MSYCENTVVIMNDFFVCGVKLRLSMVYQPFYVERARRSDLGLMFDMVVRQWPTSSFALYIDARCEEACFF